MERCCGSSLIEVLVALGLLGSLLLSVAGLVTTGSRQIHSGGLRSRALAVAHTVAEELAGWSFRQSFEAFGCAGHAPLCRVDPDALPPAWPELAAETLPQAGLAVVVSAIDGGRGLADSRALRITVTVSWREGRRPRSVSLLWLQI